RRPKIRASSEYAPGPSSAMAAAFTLVRTMYRPSVWANRKKLASSNRQASKDEIGVRTPMQRSRLSTASAAQSRNESGDIKQPAPVSKIATASENRSINKATPGAPDGNIAKRRSTLPAFHAFRVGTRLH